MKNLLFLLMLVTQPSLADEIKFSSAINVTLNKKGVFHHLDASGRKSIAANRQMVAVTWEDNRSGKPQAYVAFKTYQQHVFGKTTQLSQAKQEAYEPTVIAINENQFLFAWEQDQHVWITTGNNKTIDKPVLLDKQPSSQVSLTITPNGNIFACWIQQQQPHRQLVVSEINLNSINLTISNPVIVDSHSSPRRQAYPSITSTPQGISIAWEDREHGHTRIYSSFSNDGKNFIKKQVLNDFVPPQNVKYGRGTGATRVALSSHNNTVVATWMDKRDFLGGYDIYAAISHDAGKTFAENEIVQDMLGENQPQWHPAVAISPKGKIYVAWDDPRDDTPDIWLSYKENNEWSEDQLVEQASGAGQQNNPSISFDPMGRLHMVWIEQKATASLLQYIYQQ